MSNPLDLEHTIVEETDDQFRRTGIEAEQIVESGNTKPYDPDQIRVDPKTFSLRQILDMIDEGDLELAPDFQRLKVWTIFQKSRLIESILLRIPLPAFYFSSDPAGKLQVVDGLQRLSTIHDFVRGGKSGKDFFKLDGLEYLQDQIGQKDFKEINSPLWTRRLNNTQFIANVIDPQTPYRVKFDIFKRLNTGGSPLNAQEIRHCLSRPQSRDLLKRLAGNNSFRKATGGALSDSVRMVDREVVLRFCAFGFLPGLADYAKSGSMDEFLNRATQLIDQTPIGQLEAIETAFVISMDNAHLLFDRHAFRKWHIKNDRILPFNRALFDVWSVLLTNYNSQQIIQSKSEIVIKFRELMSFDELFISSVSSGTSDVQKTERRFREVKKLLDSIII